jgi:hypothetical protein
METGARRRHTPETKTEAKPVVATIIHADKPPGNGPEHETWVYRNVSI